MLRLLLTLGFCAVIACSPTLPTALSAASEGLGDRPREPSVEILGVKLVRGMTESEVRASFPYVNCAEEEPVDPNFDLCVIADGVPPEADGDVTFKDGLVYSASRYWSIPEGAEPVEVLMMLNAILARLAGEEDAVCAKIETHDDRESTSTIFALPEKTLTVQMHTLTGRSGISIREGLRANPVPNTYRTRGKKMQGAEWCAYAK